MQSIIESASFMAHGYCLLWQPWLVVLLAGSDLLIFTAYSLIPLALVRFLRRRPDVRFRGLVALFAAFILLCGITHLISIVTLWFPIYPVHGLVKLVTGLVSMLTAVVLFGLIPRLVAIPSPQQLEEVGARLQAEIAAHEATLARLAASQHDLEIRVRERTAELEEANQRLSVVTKETMHRAKNLLTVVGSLARQTARGAPDMTVFIDKFLGRLKALADATTTAVKGGSAGVAELDEIARSQLGPVIDAYPDRVSIEGGAMQVGTEAAQQLALAIHELATNAVKHGALSEREGTVRLSWSEEEVRGQPALRIEWTEELSAPPDKGAVSGGLGTDLLTKVVPSLLAGTGEFAFSGGALRYVLLVPRSRTAPPRPGARVATGFSGKPAAAGA